MKPHRAGFDLFDWARRHPFVVASLGLHLLLAAGLYAAGPYTLTRQQRKEDLARVGAGLEAARREQMQRHLQRLEQLGKEMGAELPASPASSPLERAEALTRRIEQAEQQRRAQEMARLLKIKPEQALAKVKVEDFRRAKPQPRDAAQALAQLERRARDAAERQRALQRRQSEGHRIGGTQTAQGGGAAGKGNGQGGMGGPGLGGAGPGRGGQGRGNGEASAFAAGIGEPDRRYDAAVTPPVLEAASLRFAEARRFGPGAPYANRVYLDRWYVAGPFPAPSSRALDEVLTPEVAVDLDAVYAGKHGLVGWRFQQSPTYPFVPEPRDGDSIYYAYTEVRVDRDTEVWLDIGADDDSRLWLNDELVWASGNGDKPWYRTAFYNLDDEMSRYALVEGRVRVTLKAGRNTLLFKLYNGIDLMFFSVVIAR